MLALFPRAQNVLPRQNMPKIILYIKKLKARTLTPGRARPRAAHGDIYTPRRYVDKRFCAGVFLRVDTVPVDTLLVYRAPITVYTQRRSTAQRTEFAVGTLTPP